MATTKNDDTAATLGFEARLWAAADALLPKLLSGEVRVGEADKAVNSLL